MSRLRMLLRRRPLLALIILVLILAVGYTARALDAHGADAGGSAPAGCVATSVSVLPSFGGSACPPARPGRD